MVATYNLGSVYTTITKCRLTQWHHEEEPHSHHETPGLLQNETVYQPQYCHS